jgi:hypothetical protein
MKKEFDLFFRLTSESSHPLMAQGKQMETRLGRQKQSRLGRQKQSRLGRQKQSRLGRQMHLCWARGLRSRCRMGWGWR